jgi:hypothetical protein
MQCCILSESSLKELQNSIQQELPNHVFENILRNKKGPLSKTLKP